MTSKRYKDNVVTRPSLTVSSERFSLSIYRDMMDLEMGVVERLLFPSNVDEQLAQAALTNGCAEVSI